MSHKFSSDFSSKRQRRFSSRLNGAQQREQQLEAEKRCLINTKRGSGDENVFRKKRRLLVGRPHEQRVSLNLLFKKTGHLKLTKARFYSGLKGLKRNCGSGWEAEGRGFRAPRVPGWITAGRGGDGTALVPLRHLY